MNLTDEIIVRLTAWTKESGVQIVFKLISVLQIKSSQVK